MVLLHGLTGIKMKIIGQYNGQPVYEVCLESATGVKVSIMSYGGIVRDWQVPTATGVRPVALGFPKFESYLNDPAHIGALVGRVANRIAGAEFSFGGRSYTLPANVGTDLLHGGTSGLGRRNWKMEMENGETVLLRYHSPSGEMGFPGDVDFSARYRLNGYRLRLEFSATVSETTPISLVQHHYFNLMGSGSVVDHRFQISGDRFTPLSERLLPTGEIRSVENTHFDFRSGRTLRSSDGAPLPYDVNFGLAVEDRKVDPVAVVQAPDNSLALRLWTDRPGLQFYTSEYLDSVDNGHNGERYRKFEGFCLEDQMFPDALHHPQFPSILVTPDTPYSHWCEIEIK